VEGGTSVDALNKTKDLLCFNLLNTEQVVAMTGREMDNYKQSTSSIEKKIEQTKGDIAAAKIELEAAKGVRRNREGECCCGSRTLTPIHVVLC
jgi:hypothetical protein